MSDLRQNTVRNGLLAKLPRSDFELLAPWLERIAVKSNESLSQSGERPKYVHFPEQGSASVTIEADPYKIEVGMVGREGLVGLPVLLGGGSCRNHTFVQMPGSFFRISAEDFLVAARSSPTMAALFLRYVQAYLFQVSCTAMANAGYTVEQRLARWLLMAHDRADEDDLALTHETMAFMLGVRRPGVTVAMHVLEGEHMVKSKRGLLTMLDRDKLKKFAKGSYGRPEAEYDRLIGGAGAALSVGSPPQEHVQTGP